MHHQSIVIQYFSTDVQIYFRQGMYNRTTQKNMYN